MNNDSAVESQQPLVVRTFDPATTDPVEAIFGAIDEVEFVDLTTAEPLANVIDPDALDAIFGRRAPHEHVEVAFRYEGLEIRLAGDHTIHVMEDAADGYGANR